MVNKDKFYMKRAIEIAKKGKDKTYPNPLVGAVVVKGKKVIGEGYHEYFGGNHAEINALAKAGNKANGSTVYINLEPCSHYGKTPPCTEALIKSKVKKVIIAMTDSNSLVSGRGIKKLKGAGIEVVTGIMKKEAVKLNKDYIQYNRNRKKEKLQVILKIAMTLDGKIATAKGESKWITSEKSREFVHRLRGESDAIITGSATVIADNPLLNVRIKGKHRNPVRVILDSSCSVSEEASIIRDKSAKTMIITSQVCSEKKIKILKAKGIDVVVMEKKKGSYFDLRKVIKMLNERGLKRIMIEGGSYLNYSAISSGIVDKLYIFIAPKIIGGKSAKTAVGGTGVDKLINAFKIKNIKVSRIGEDILICGER